MPKKKKNVTEEPKYFLPSYDRKPEGYSFSSWWRDRFDGWGSYNFGYDTLNRRSWADEEEAEFATKLKMYRGLRSIARTVNIYAGAAGVRQLSVAWSGGMNTNKAKSDTIYLSGKVLEGTLKPSWKESELLDVLVGEALTESGKKYEVDPAVEEEVKIDKSQKGVHTRDLWNLFEHLNAQAVVREKYQGFVGYFSTAKTYHTVDGVKKRILEFAEKGWDPEVALLMMEWNLLHPEDPIEIPKRYRKVHKAKPFLREPMRNSEERYQVARKIIKTLFPDEPECGEGNDGKKPNITLRQMGGPSDLTAAVEGSPVDAMTVDLNKEKNHEHFPKTLGDEPPHGILTLRPSLEDYKEFRNTYRKLSFTTASLSAAIASKIKLRAEDKVEYERGLRRGDVDPGAIYKLGFPSEEDGHLMPAIFEHREIIRTPKAGGILLVDESGSMGRLVDWTQYVAVALANAFKKVDGLDLGVLGHTGQGTGHGTDHFNGMIIHEYYSPNRKELANLGMISSFQQNLDGFAIQRAAEYALKWWPEHDPRFVIHISDGLPEAHGYGGSAAIQHIGKVCRRVHSEGVQVFGILLPNGRGDFNEVMRRMYGHGNYAVISKVEHLPELIPSMIRRSFVLKSERVQV